MKKNREIYFHILGCVLFLSLPILLSPDFSTTLDFFHIPPFQEDFASYAFLLIFFYLNFYFFLPRFYFKKKYIAFAILMIISYDVIVMIPEYFMSEGRNYLYSEEFRDEMSRPKPFRNHFFHEFTQHLLQFLLVLIFSLMLRISLRWKQAEKEKLSVELSYLKAQINPHFLFNTLNSIYSLAIEKSDYAPTAIVKLSEMMRYVTTEADKNFVSLEKELRYISSYIELQKIRFGETIRFSFSQSGKIKDQKIAPLILISFVENAFKHGVNPEEDSEIDVNISVTEDTLHLIVYNKKVTVRLQEEVRTEMGIGNTRNRLQMLYPLKHELVITDAKDSYSVSLTINLK